MGFGTCYVWVFMAILHHSIKPHEIQKQTIETCSQNNGQRRFDVLPGRGWDNLLNQMKAQVWRIDYSECRYSFDKANLLPDNVSLIPIKTSEIFLQSETFHHYRNYTPTISPSINSQAHNPMMGPDGSFSKEYQAVKLEQIRTKSIFNRVQFRYDFLRSIFEQDAQLDPVFRNRIMEIATILSCTKDVIYSQHLADLIVRDFGTHVIQSIDSGAVLSKIDFLKPSYVKKYQHDPSKLSSAAAASFTNFFNFNFNYKHKNSTSERIEYDRNTISTRINAYGGSFLGSSFSVEKWLQSIPTNLAAIDKFGIPIFDVIDRKSLPEVDDQTLYNITKLLQGAVRRYYDANSIAGCLDFRSPDYEPEATLDSGSCKPPEINFTFGGIFQTCYGWHRRCEMNQVNFLTGSYSCPDGYRALQLTHDEYHCEQVCHYYYWYRYYDCNSYCSYYNTFWCYPVHAKRIKNGLLFGGFISESMPNCPHNYKSVRFGISSHLCVTTSVDEHNINFGGFYSCRTGNPLAVESNRLYTELHDLPRDCPPGYVAHIVSLERNCHVSYCVQGGKVQHFVSVTPRGPPFIEVNYNLNVTSCASKAEDFHDDIISQLQRHNRLVNGIIGFIAVIALLSVGLVMGFICFKLVGRKKAADKNSETGTVVEMC